MAETDTLHQYNSLSIDELYNVLFNAIKNMCDASDGKDHQLFLDYQNEVYFIKSIIEESHPHEVDSFTVDFGLRLFYI